jgi:hypothetical protein
VKRVTQGHSQNLDEQRVRQIQLAALYYVGVMKKDLSLLEQVRRRAACFTMNCYSSSLVRRPSSYRAPSTARSSRERFFSRWRISPVTPSRHPPRQRATTAMSVRVNSTLTLRADLSPMSALGAARLRTQAPVNFACCVFGFPGSVSARRRQLPLPARRSEMRES